MGNVASTERELTRRKFLKAGGGALAGVYALQLAGCGPEGQTPQGAPTSSSLCPTSTAGTRWAR